MEWGLGGVRGKRERMVMLCSVSQADALALTVKKAIKRSREPYGPAKAAASIRSKSSPLHDLSAL